VRGVLHTCHIRGVTCHINGAAALYRGGGSIAFVAACRLAWLAAPDPRATGRYVLAQQKNNLGPEQPSLAYTLPEDAPRVDWLGESVWRAEDLGRRKRRPLLQRACEFLRDFLAPSARPVSEIWTAAQAAGIGESTLRRAKDELRLRSQLIRRPNLHATYWLLPTQMLPEELQTPLDKYLQPVIEEWGNRCPLEREEEAGGEERCGVVERDDEQPEA
jgi:hypothetical protein